MTTRFTLNVTSDNLDQEGKGLSQNATMMSDNPDDIIAALSQLAGVNRASNNYGAQEVNPDTGCGCNEEERVEEEYANQPEPEVYSAAGGVGDLVDTGHTAKAKNRYTKAGFGDNPLAEDGDTPESVLAKVGSGELDIYDVMNHPKTPVEQQAAKIIHQLYDDVAIDNHLHPDDDFETILDIVAEYLDDEYGATAESYDTELEESFNKTLMTEWKETKLQGVSQEFDVEAAMKAIFEGKEEFTQGSKQFVVRKDADIVKVFPLMENRTLMTMPLLVLDAAALVKESEIEEKAKSKAQQQFMGMVHAAQQGEEPASPEVAKVAKEMGKKDVEDFASTKHKGLPDHVKEDQDSVDAVAGAITRRIMSQHVDVLSKYGPVKVMAAIDDVAQFAGGDGLDEIGSSDVSIWTKQVIQDLEAGHFDHVDEELGQVDENPALMAIGGAALRGAASAAAGAAVGAAVDKLTSKKPATTEGDFVSTLSAMAAARYQPKVGDKIRTRKGGQIPGTVEKVGEVSGIEYCWFRHPEGKLYKTPCSNVMREGMDEEQVDEVSKDTLDSYADKASAERDELHGQRNDSADDARKYFNRKNGVRQALAKSDKMENIEMDEELQQIRALAGMHEAAKPVDEEETQEGNEFSHALAKAKASGADEFEVDGKKYPVKEASESDEDEEDKMDEGKKPDFLDVDKDGDKEESMKDAIKDKEEKVDEDADFAYMMSLLNKWR